MAKAALQKFVDHYPSGVNPYLDEAYGMARDALAAPPVVAAAAPQPLVERDALARALLFAKAFIDVKVRAMLPNEHGNCGIDSGCAHAASESENFEALDNAVDTIMAALAAPPVVDPGARGGYSREESDRLASIRERLAKATKGPWGLANGRWVLEPDPADDGGYPIIAAVEHRHPNRDANADFIAHAPDDLAWLLAHFPPPTASPAVAASQEAPVGDALAVAREIVREWKLGCEPDCVPFTEDNPRGLWTPDKIDLENLAKDIAAALAQPREGTQP